MQEARQLVEEWLGLTTSRDLFSARELQDFLLELWGLLAETPDPAADEASALSRA